MHMQVVELLLA